MSPIPIQIWALLIATPCAIAIGQVLFKVTGARLSSQADATFLSIFLEPVFLLALGLYGGATLVWIYVLKVVPLGQAYSFMALTFLIVPVLALYFLGETLTLRYAIGALLIMAGLLVIHS